ncbi:hypothetical protein Cgig2_030243 [Carnegiea gigantea]|uniref:Chalcone synthase n=1 Tax=Carnegiea gigantea TaxID=171969 RepID=A0A9Q1QK25_9CARY|nr:hypothetical protein Cgig2_030243 [Carnegiea gigantea]
MTDLKQRFKRMCETSMIKNRYMLLSEEMLKENPHGCYARGTVLRLAKYITENNRGAHVLVVCSEITDCFRGPTETHLDPMVGQALFEDGARALVWAAQSILFDSGGAIDGHLRQVSLAFHLLKDVPGLISKNIEKALTEPSAKLASTTGNPSFGRLIQVEAKLGLKQDKLSTTRHVLSEFGIMSSACVMFTLDEMRKKSLKEGKATTGEGLDWGVLFGFGPGLIVETVMLRSVPITN